MSSLGARFDAWLTTDPAAEAPDEPLPGDPDWPRCEADGGCGAFLPGKPDDVTTGWTTVRCNGNTRWDQFNAPCGDELAHAPHEEVINVWDTERRVCRSCGRNNYRVVA